MNRNRRRYTPRRSTAQGLVGNGNDIMPVETGLGGRNPYHPSSARRLSNRRTGNYVSLKFENTNTTGTADLVIFDPSGGFQFSTGITTSAGVNITGITTDYQLFLNRLARFDIHTAQMQLVVEQGSTVQFNHPIKQYYFNTDFDTPLPEDIIHPAVYRHSGQENDQMIDYFKFETIWDQNTALVTKLEPGTCLVMNLMLKGEWARTV